MSKGFILALAAIGALFYFLHESDPVAGGAVGAGSGLVEIDPGNYELYVSNSSEPVLVYYWASW